MGTRQSKQCPVCAGFRDEISALNAKVARLEEELAKARKDSSNSSKPPSSDIVNPPKKGPTSHSDKKRKPGGQNGHPKHQRPPFSENEIDHSFDYVLDVCPDCGHVVEVYGEPVEVVQQAELVEKPLEIIEHRGRACWCPRCQTTHFVPVPCEVKKAGLVGPRLTALVAYLKGCCHASFSTIRKFLRDVAGLTISRGQLGKVIAKVSRGLADAYEEVYGTLSEQPYLRVDETGHKENGQRFWTWCFRAELYTVFRIDKSRGSQVLIEALGEEFHGVLSCDYFSAYRKYMREFNVVVQFCLAHFIRDVKFLLTLPDKQEQAYGRRLRDALKTLFGVIHRREEMDASEFQQALEQARDAALRQGTVGVPKGKHAQNLAQRLLKHGEAYFCFVTTPGIDPTNNIAEQAIRFVVIDRYVTHGTRSLTGREWCQRIWTVIASCTQQGRSVFEFLYESISAYFREIEGPSLIPDTS